METVEAGGIVRGRGEADEVEVVDVVGEALEAGVEALLGGEVGVLAAGELGEGVGDVFAEGFDGHDKEAVVAGAEFSVHDGVDDGGLAGVEGDGVNDGVGAA